MNKRKIVLISFLFALFGIFAIISVDNHILLSGYFIDFSQKQALDVTAVQFLDWQKTKKKLPQRPEEVSLIAVGDISFSRGVEKKIKAQKNSFYPFLKIMDYFVGADIVWGNLESPITSGREISDGEMIFRSNPGTEKILKEAGVGLLSLANNHALDFGEKGQKDTLDYLNQSGIKYVGAGYSTDEAYQPSFFELKGIRIAFFDYVDPSLILAFKSNKSYNNIALMDIEKMTIAVKEAKQKADIVIVSMHAGFEYTNEPNKFQINFAHSAIDAGANLVIGHHPHVIQPMEKYKNRYIFYSLGNFVFDQMWSQETKEGLAIKIYLTKDEVDKISFFPVVIENFSQPRMASGREAEKILKKLNFTLSEEAIYSWNGQTKVFEKSFRKALNVRSFLSNAVISKKKEADIDKDLFQEMYILENGKLKIETKSQMIWQSPDDWWVDDFILADSTNDGIVDINLSVWKEGSFGLMKPFWIKEDDKSIKNHFFIYNFIKNEPDLATEPRDIRTGTLRDVSVSLKPLISPYITDASIGDIRRRNKIEPVWQSSNLPYQNQEMAIVDIDNDNKNELIVIESDYSDKDENKENYIAVWRWNSWGFLNEWRSEKGNFANLKIEKIDGKNYITADLFSL